MIFKKKTSDFIEVYDNIISRDDCQSIIKYFESKKSLWVHGLVGSSVDVKKKDAWELGTQHFSSKGFVEKILYAGIVAGTKPYIEKYSVIAGYMDPWTIEDGYNIQKYDPGGAYWIPHCEQSGVIQSTRMLVWMVYLNTVTDGGGTKFTCYDRTIDAREGRLVIWPASWPHTHQGIVSKTQFKYIATGWYIFA